MAKTIHGIDLTAPGGIAALMAFHRLTFGDAVMELDPEAPADAVTAVDPAADPEAPAVDPAEDPDPEGAEALGDPGKRALDSMKEKLREARATLKERDSELSTLRKPAEPSTDPEAIRAEIRAELTKESSGKLLRAEVKATAAGAFQDAELALSLVDLEAIHVGANGEADPDDIQDAIDAVLAKYPYLAAQSGSKKRVPNVPADPAKPDTKAPTLAEQIKSAEAAGDFRQSMALKSQQLAGIATK